MFNNQSLKSMSRRPEDSENWGGKRNGSGRKQLWNTPEDTKRVMFSIPVPLKEVLVKIRDRGIPMKDIIAKLEELLK